MITRMSCSITTSAQLKSSRISVSAPTSSSLSRSVRPDQPEDLSLAELEVDAVDRADAAEVHLEPPRLEQLATARRPRGLGLCDRDPRSHQRGLFGMR